MFYGSSMKEEGESFCPKFFDRCFFSPSTLRPLDIHTHNVRESKYTDVSVQYKYEREEKNDQKKNFRDRKEAKVLF